MTPATAVTPIPMPRELVALIGDGFTGPVTLHLRKGLIMAIEATKKIDLVRERELRG